MHWQEAIVKSVTQTAYRIDTERKIKFIVRKINFSGYEKFSVDIESNSFIGSVHSFDGDGHIIEPAAWEGYLDWEPEYVINPKEWKGFTKENVSQKLLDFRKLPRKIVM